MQYTRPSVKRVETVAEVEHEVQRTNDEMDESNWQHALLNTTSSRTTTVTTYKRDRERANFQRDGCMGLRDLNRDNPKKQRDAITALHDLPNLKRASWYHSPLMPDDSHLTYIVSHFPKLEDLGLDFTAPSGSQTTVTPAGLTLLQKLPLTALNIEGSGTLTPDHFKALAGIKTLKKLTLGAGKLPIPADGLAAFKQARPDVDVLAGPASATAVIPPKKKS